MRTTSIQLLKKSRIDYGTGDHPMWSREQNNDERGSLGFTVA